MQTEAKIDVVRRLCIDAILYHQDATTLLNAVYAKIQIPLIAFDETIALIAYAFPRPFYFEDWEEIVEYGTCPKKKVLQNLRDYQEVIYRNRAPTVISWGTCAELPQIRCPIICRDFLYGYIGMAPQAGSDMEEMSVIEAMLAKTLGRILNDEQRTDVLAPEQYVSHLLMRDKPDYKVLDAYGKHFAPPYLFVMLMSPVVNEAELQYVLGHICRTQPQVIGCASESRYLYLLVAGMDSDTARVMINRHLRAVALQTDYYVSFSDVFYDIRTLPQHKLQATLTQTVNTALGRSEHVSSFVENYPDIIGYYSIEHYGKAAVLPYVLQKLAKLDAQEGKDYIPTLSCYLGNSMHLSPTSHALNLHPNTVRSRLERIGSITGLDLEDYDTLIQLRTGLHIYDLLRTEDAKTDTHDREERL